MAGPVRDNKQYVDNAIASVGYSVSLKGGPYWLYPKRGDPFLMPRSDFQCDLDPFSSGRTSIELVYRSRAAAMAALAGTPMKLAYYAGERGVVFPTTLSSSTTPRLCEALRKAREMQLKDVASLQSLSGRLLLVISLATMHGSVAQEPALAAAQGLESGASATLTRQTLITELRASGARFTESAIQGITRSIAGRIIWLESGGATAGLTHIMARHGTQFAQWGLRSAQQVSDLLLRVVGTQAPVSVAGDAQDFVVMIDGVERMVRIVISSNGYIVTAHPL